MAIKDYKKKSPTAQPSTKRSPIGEGASKKATTAFGVGFLSGLLVATALFTVYLNNYYLATNGKPAETATTDKTENKAQPETSAATEAPKDQPKSQSIDYQFYEELAKFTPPPAPTTDPPPQDGTIPPLIQNIGDGANDKAGGGAGKDNEDNKNNTEKSPARYILQAGTFSTALRAQIQRRKIVDLGYKDVHVFQAAYNDKQYHRVWLGPYRGLEQARTIANALKAARIEVMLRHDLRSFEPRESRE